MAAPGFLEAMLPPERRTAAKAAPSLPGDPPPGDGKRLPLTEAAPVRGWCDRPVRVDGAYGVMDYARSCGRCQTCRARKARR